MGTRCPLHPISSLSHGGFSPGREKRHEEEERQDLCFLVQKIKILEHMCAHTQDAHTYTNIHLALQVSNGLDLPTI